MPAPTVQEQIAADAANHGLRRFEQLRREGAPYLQAVAIANAEQRQLWQQARQAQGLG